MEHLIAIRPNGVIEFMYDDDLRPLFETGEPKIRRASHVEPTPDGLWQADLSPIGGPVLNATQRREDALRQEAQWIQKEYLRVV